MTHKATVFEDGVAICMARVVGADGSNITQASVDTIKLYVHDADDAEVIGETAVTVASAVFDTLQTDARWTYDDQGYNFRYTVPATAFPTAGTHYVEFKITDTSGNVFWLAFDCTALEIRAS